MKKAEHEKQERRNADVSSESGGVRGGEEVHRLPRTGRTREAKPRGRGRAGDTRIMTLEKRLVQSKYDGDHHAQCCGACGGTEFTDTTAFAFKNGNILVIAQCTRCDEINIMR